MSKVLTFNQQAQANTTTYSEREIQQWLIHYLANLLEMPQENVETNIPFDSYGLDSAAAVGMTGELEAWLGQDVDPTLPYIYTTIEALAQHLAAGVDIKAHRMEAL